MQLSTTKSDTIESYPPRGAFSEAERAVYKAQIGCKKIQGTSLNHGLYYLFADFYYTIFSLSIHLAWKPLGTSESCIGKCVSGSSIFGSQCSIVIPKVLVL